MEKNWKATNVENAEYIGTLEVNEECFEILKTENKLVFGGACNVGFLESGYMEIEEGESADEALQELHGDLESFYQNGREYVSRIVCNERM